MHVILPMLLRFKNFLENLEAADMGVGSVYSTFQFQKLAASPNSSLTFPIGCGMFGVNGCTVILPYSLFRCWESR
jgi:hypothetical protein